MGNVNSDAKVMAALIRQIDEAENDIYRQVQSLKNKYVQAAEFKWQDSKYTELESITGECTARLEQIIWILSYAKDYIEALVKAIRLYEDINLTTASSPSHQSYSAPSSMPGSAADAEATAGFGHYRGTYNACESAAGCVSFSALEKGTSSDTGIAEGVTGTDSVSEAGSVPASGDVSASVNRDCLGIRVCTALPEGYDNIISIRFENALLGVREVFERFSGNLIIRNAQYPSGKTAHYSPRNLSDHPGGVYYNAAADMNNPRGAGTTYFHELAHMIDHAAGGFTENLSNTPEFAEALQQDGKNILEMYSSLSSDRQEIFLNRIRADRAHSLSDLLGAVTGSVLCGRYGHSREYWNREGNLQAEAFAHFFEASMGNSTKLKLLANFFPNAFALFNSMIESLRCAAR